MVGRNSLLIKELYCKVKQYHTVEERLPDEFYNKDVQNSSLIPKLRPYQVKAVRWMLARELINCVVEVSNDDGVKVELPKGGILADEMGLGKTVEILACILENPLKDINRLKSMWMDNVSHLSKAYECLSEKKTDSKDEIFVTQIVDISADHSYSNKKEHQTPLRNSRSCKRVSFKGLFDDDVNEDNKNFNLHEDTDNVAIRKERKRRKADDKSKIGSEEKKKRRSSLKSTDLDDADYSPKGETLNKVVKKRSPGEIKMYLTNWYESKLMETTLAYREERKRALKFIPDFRCCCSDEMLLNSELDDLTQIKCPSCDKFQHSQCLGVDDEFDLINPYLCFQCWPKQKHLVPSGGTIIISPNTILNQWLTEIDKHILKPGLNVLVYEGVRRNGYIQPTVLAQYDIVLTSYQVLIKELDYVDREDGARSLRYAKRFHAPSSPLTSVLWWRLCLDEAQMIECTTTKVTSMVKNLTAINKWAVCGTPIQKSIHDLYGLFGFLQVNPYDELIAWSRLQRSKDIMFELIPYIMWRMSKADVINEIGVPPQTVLLHMLKFSPVETHFYQKQHTDCSKQFMEKWAAFDDLNILLDKLDRKSTNKLLGPLLRLRQACVHPQLVRGQFVAIKKTMTMEELLKFMVLKAVVDCEGALRLVIASLNGIAALLIILSFREDAVDHYRQVLHLIQEYDGRLKVDSLQKIHTMHNLAEILDSVKANVPRTLRDETLGQATAELENAYMEKRKGDMDGTKKTLQTFSKNIHKQSEGKPLDSSVWWVHMLSHVPEPEEFINRLKIDLGSSKTQGVNLLSKVSNRYALIEELRQWLVRIESNRKKVITTLDQLEKIKQEELAEAALACHLKQKNKKQTGEKRCLLCKCETYLKSYESNLFSITNTSMPSDDLDCSTSSALDEDFDDIPDETVDEPNEEENRIVADLKDKTMFETYNAGNWQASQQEQALRMLIPYARLRHCKKVWLNEGQKHLQVLDIVKKEFRFLRLLWTQMFDCVAARDELSMAKVRLRLPYPGEKIKKREEKKDIHIIAPHQVEMELARLKSEKATAEVDLKKKLGTLLYLQNLQKRENNKGDQIELCPICHNQLKDKWSVLICGHYLCFDCVPALLDMCGGTHLLCAICRERSESGDVSYIEGEYDKGPDFLPVKGSHTTKIQAVVSELLKLRNKEPNVKVLIFSVWDRVLDLLCEAFSLNDISYRRLANNSLKKKNLNVSEFKNDNITALLLPIRLGAKGLNLVEATHVFLVEPLLNPADELQAVGRVHRIGQTRETFVHRFIIRDTIEERMLSVIDGSGQDEWNKENLTVGRLINLFSVDGNVNDVPSETEPMESNGVCQISDSESKNNSENVSLLPATPNQAREIDVHREISLLNIPGSFASASDTETVKSFFGSNSSSGEPSNYSDSVNDSGCYVESVQSDLN